MTLSFVLQGACPDIDIVQIPSDVEDVHRLARFARDKARKQLVWDKLMDPRHAAVYRREFKEQLERIRLWQDYHILRLLGRLGIEDNTTEEEKENIANK